MPVNEFEPGFEEVFTVSEYYDGPRQGIANFCGSPNFYDCVFSDEKQHYLNRYRLTRISDDAFRLALEDWATWTRWEGAFKAGKTTRTTHPALPDDAARHTQIQELLTEHLKTDPERSVIRSAKFLRVPSGDRADRLAVRWSEPTESFEDRIWAEKPYSMP
jgi:hypothetical protein